MKLSVISLSSVFLWFLKDSTNIRIHRPMNEGGAETCGMHKEVQLPQHANKIGHLLACLCRGIPVIICAFLKPGLYFSVDPALKLHFRGKQHHNILIYSRHNAVLHQNTSWDCDFYTGHSRIRGFWHNYTCFQVVAGRIRSLKWSKLLSATSVAGVLIFLCHVQVSSPDTFSLPCLGAFYRSVSSQTQDW